MRAEATKMATRTRKQRPQTRRTFRPKARWIRQGKPLSYDKLIWTTVERFFQKTPEERLRALAIILEKDEKRGKKLAERLKVIATSFQDIDKDWGNSGLKDMVTHFIDLHIEKMLPSLLNVTMHQLNVEGLLTDTECMVHYQEHMRLAAGLPQRMSNSTDSFIEDIDSILVTAERKKRNKIRPGGKTSQLRQYSHALCFHYERLHPIWRTVKAIYNRYGDSQQARKEVVLRYSELGKGERWAIKVERVGLPPKLLDQLEEGDA